jgi:hypothetical protein
VRLLRTFPDSNHLPRRATIPSAGLGVREMTRSHQNTPPCPLCGRITRAHSRLVLADVETPGTSRPTRFATTICRDCAFAMVVRSQALAPRL